MMTSKIIKIFIVLGMILPFVFWLNSVGDPKLYLQDEVPAGQLIYAISKLLGLFAFALLWLQFVLVGVKDLLLVHLVSPSSLKSPCLTWLMLPLT